MNNLLRSKTSATCTHAAGLVNGRWGSGSDLISRLTALIKKNTLMALLARSTFRKNKES